MFPIQVKECFKIFFGLCKGD